MGLQVNNMRPFHTSGAVTPAFAETSHDFPRISEVLSGSETRAV